MDFTFYDVSLIPLITALIQLAKGLGLNKKYSPLLSLALGLLAGIFYIEPSNISIGILTGLMIGLSASGLYSTSKVSVQQTNKKSNNHV